jgi:hypothetical protein
MEALILSLFALLAIVLLEAGSWIAIALARWAPVIATGALATGLPADMAPSRSKLWALA